MSGIKDECPHCHGDLRAGEIPVEYLEKGYYGPWSPGDPPRYYSKLIGIEDGTYDGVSWWHCPLCGATWSRWTGELKDPPDPAMVFTP